MSHERSTPSSSGSQELAPSSTSSQLFGGAPSSLVAYGSGNLTPLEKWALGRSDSAFHALAGAAGGFTSGVVTCPLDVIKTKLQAQGGFRTNRPPGGPPNVVYSGLFGTAKVIWREEGLKGMYRGLGPIILGYLPTWAVWFTVYGKSKVFFSQYSENRNVVNFWSSIAAGASSTMVTNPIWVIKTRLMSQVSRKAVNNDARPPWYYRSTFDAAKKMYRTEGILSFYSGLTPALLGLTHVAVQFPAYEYLKTKFTGQGMGMSAEGNQSSQWMGILSASLLSKVLASSATYPHEVIRTRLQTQQRSMPSSTSEFVAFRGGLEGSEHAHGSAALVAKAKAVVPKYRGIVTTFQTILKEEGWRAFYAGMGTNMMRAVPAATTTMLTYEFIMQQATQARADAQAKSAASTLW